MTHVSLPHPGRDFGPNAPSRGTRMIDGMRLSRRLGGIGFCGLLAGLLATTACPAAGQSATTTTAAALRIHVAVDGDDSADGSDPAAPGSGTGPVASLARAQGLARAALAEMRAGARERVPVVVVVGSGTHALSEPLVFTPEDSGTADAPMRYEARIAGTAVLSGGVRLEPAADAPESGDWAYALPAAAGRTAQRGGQLFVEGARATLAREPDEGSHWFVVRRVGLAGEPEGQRGHEAFAVPAPARAWLSALSEADRERAIVQVMHSWNTSQHRIADFAPESGLLRVAPRSKWAWLSSGHSQRWFVENVPAALTAGGEWLAAPSPGRPGELHYRPTAAQAGSAGPGEAVLAVLERLVIVRGEPRWGRKVEHLQFRGLHFAHTRYELPASGFVDPQAAIAVGAAFEAEEARHLLIDGCTFSRTASYAIWLRRGATDSKVVRSHFQDLGGGAIQIGEAQLPPGDAVLPARHEVRNNRIGRTGAVFPGAVAVWIGQASDVEVAHNLIHDTSYTGISVGWTWGFRPAAPGRHRIDNNLLVNIGQGRLSDMGGIYTLGRLGGTTIRGNLIREVRVYPGYGPGPGLGGWGIYNDEGTSDVLTEGNVVVGTDSGGYHLHYGSGNLVRANLFAGGGRGELRVSKQLALGEGELPQVSFLDNLLLPGSGLVLDGVSSEPHAKFSGNLVANAAIATVRSTGDVDRCGGGCSAAAMRLRGGTTDPKALSIEGVGSAIAARIARTIAMAGPEPGAVNTRAGGASTLASHLQWPALRPRQSAPSLAPALPLVIAPPIHSGPGERNRGAKSQLPDGLEYRPLNDAQAIRWIEDSTSPAGACLELNDRADLKNRFDPHAFGKLNHVNGRSTVEFSILIDEQADFIHEWRDEASPYRSGPSLRLTAEGVWVGGQLVAAVPAGRWLHVRVSADLDMREATWTLELRGGVHTPIVLSNLRPVTPGWRELRYVAFLSNAKEASRSCLAGIRVVNSNQLR